MRYQWDGWETRDMDPDLDDAPNSTADLRLHRGSRPRAPHPKPVKDQ